MPESCLACLPRLVRRAVLISTASVALMGQARGKYTIFRHRRWMPVIATGYAPSILVRMWTNDGNF